MNPFRQFGLAGIGAILLIGIGAKPAEACWLRCCVKRTPTYAVQPACPEVEKAYLRPAVSAIAACAQEYYPVICKGDVWVKALPPTTKTACVRWSLIGKECFKPTRKDEAGHAHDESERVGLLYPMILDYQKKQWRRALTTEPVDGFLPLEYDATLPQTEPRPVGK